MSRAVINSKTVLPAAWGSYSITRLENTPLRQLTSLCTPRQEVSFARAKIILPSTGTCHAMSNLQSLTSSIQREKAHLVIMSIQPLIRPPSPASSDFGSSARGVWSFPWAGTYWGLSASSLRYLFMCAIGPASGVCVRLCMTQPTCYRRSNLAALRNLVLFRAKTKRFKMSRQRLMQPSRGISTSRSRKSTRRPYPNQRQWFRCWQGRAVGSSFQSSRFYLFTATFPNPLWQTGTLQD